MGHDVKVLLFANTAWYVFNFRIGLASELRNRGWEVIVVAPYDRFVPKLESEGFRVTTLGIRRSSLNPLEELLLFMRFLRIVRTEQPQMIHSFTIRCVVVGGLVGRITKVPRISAIAGTGSLLSSRDILSRIMGPVLRKMIALAVGGPRSRTVFQNPDDLRSFTSANTVLTARAFLIRGSGVDESKFYPSDAESDASPAKLRTLFAGRLIREKGVDIYLRIAKDQYSSDRCFLLAGEPDSGNLYSVSAEEHSSWKNHPYVTVLGHVERMSDLLRTVDLVVLPSTYGEGVPRILIEAAASGVPCVAFDMPGVREIVSNGINGFLVPPDDEDAMAMAVDRVLSMGRKERREMGKAARRMFLAGFTQQQVVDETITAYRSAIEDNESITDISHGGNC